MKRSYNNTLAAIRTGVRILALSTFGAALLSQNSCVGEDRSDCTRDRLLYIVVDTEGWDAEDVANTVEGATVFLFNSDRTFISSVEVSGRDIADNVPIELRYDDDDIPWVAVWANLGDMEIVSVPAPGDRAENMFVTMVRHPEGYTPGVDMLFYGAQQLTDEDEQYVTIAPKTGRIAITARGAEYDGDPDSYLFVVETPYDSYDFTGAPIGGDPVVMRFPGVFNGDELILPQPYHMFHFPDPATPLTVSLYDNRGASPRLLAEVQYDSAGMPLVIQRARTLNILIDLIGDIRVSVVVTDWDQIYTQWDVW